MAYVGWELQGRDVLLEIFPPKHPDVLAHHVTLTMNAKMPLPTETYGELVGIVDQDGVQAVVVMIAGTIARPDGKVYHITWSIDREAGAKPFHANRVIAEHGYTAFLWTVPVDLVPKLFT